MGRSKLFSVALSALLMVAAFIVGYEVRPSAPAAAGVRVAESVPRPQGSVFQNLAQALTQPHRESFLKGQGGVDPVETLREVLTHLQEKYVTEIRAEERAKLAYGAVHGMLEALDDPYTRFMEPSDYKEFQQESEGEFEGIGAYLGFDPTGKITIISTFEGNPADVAGVKAGDHILKIDGEPTDRMSLDVAVSKIRGPVDTEVVLTVERSEAVERDLKVSPTGGIHIPADLLKSAHLTPNQDLKMTLYGPILYLEPADRPKADPEGIDIRVKRGRIKIPVLKKNLLPGNIGHVWLQIFNEVSLRQLDEALTDLQKQGLRGLILDLRYNPGGLLDMAVAVASKFIPPGPAGERRAVVYTEGRAIDPTTEWAQPSEYRELGVPLVVLVNKSSASASEIVAGAIQDYQVGRIVGATTFGKGLVQTVIPLHDDSAVAITTAKYLTPKRRDINKTGIVPDVEVATPEDFEPAEIGNLEQDTQLQAALKLFQDQAPAQPKLTRG